MTLARRMAGRRLLAAALVVGLAIAGWAAWLWARDVSLLRVRHVEIEGVSGKEAPAIERALRQTARRMTTLHVREDELAQAVDRFLVVRSVSASVDFPTTLRITVSEHEPVAVLVSSGGRRIAVSGAGVMLRGIGSGTRLPEVQVGAVPDSRMLDEGQARALVRVLGGAPKELRHLLARAYGTRKGVRVAVRHGPVIEFGSPARIAAKWAAATRVLADPASSGAGVVDVRLPERPAASGDVAASASNGKAAAEAGASSGAVTTAEAQTTEQAAPAAGTTGAPVANAPDAGAPAPSTGPTAAGDYTQP